MIKMIALILGGGAGSRLAPLTSQRSKPAVPIAGKYRLIDIPISNCLNSGLKRMFVLTQYNSASLNKHIKNTYHFDMFSHGFVDILAAEQTPSSDQWFQGTADAVRQSMHHLANHDYDYLLILSGDQLYQMNFETLVNYHIEKDADLTIATIPVSDRDASGFGIMKVNAEGYIEDFVEKPKANVLEAWESAVDEENRAQGKVYLASMGIYVFSRAIMKKLFDENEKAIDFGKEIIPNAISSNYKIASFSYDGYWTDIGTIRSFFEANIALADPLPEFNLFDGENPIYTRPRLLAPTKVYGTFLNKALVAEGCIIHAKKVDRAVIGIRSRIGEGTEISNAIVMGADYYESVEDISLRRHGAPMGIGKDCYIENAIIDKNCRIGNNVVIKGSPLLHDQETDTFCVRDGIVVLKKRAYIPDGTKIGLV
ncbi:MAG: glucose-1-phosphate adenylyltransferase [Haliscomenobacter sp.]|nr:glucose-1-phosphate adenylyltransferase [Haliscomenobacter sp.]MBK8653933.1 glucose-1-phosphate adenylyltransferase [Haliscomenobacter sp.]MBP9078532.1 glucose-1-phosphate adenylyltransferase [Haliscomenobacter sp.]